VLTLSSKHITDSSLNNSLREAPNNAIILLEDIDALFPTRAQKKKREEEAKFTAWQYVTFSGLLNAIGEYLSSNLYSPLSLFKQFISHSHDKNLTLQFFDCNLFLISDYCIRQLNA
jgi:hypothetical protein